MDTWVVSQISFWFTVSVSCGVAKVLLIFGDPMHVFLTNIPCPHKHTHTHLTLCIQVYEIQPAVIVDKVIDFWMDLVTPGRGAGQRDWWQRMGRQLEQTVNRTQREMEIRRDLRQWDNEHPQIHHELIVRWVCGAVVSVAATNLYNSLVRRHSRRY